VLNVWLQTWLQVPAADMLLVCVCKVHACMWVWRQWWLGVRPRCAQQAEMLTGKKWVLIVWWCCRVPL
jgi:hypothetical protein